MNQKNIKQRIINYFFLHPTARHRVRELERALGLPLASVIRYCKELEKEEILKLDKIGSVAFYTASRSEKYLLEKRLYNIKALYQSGLVEYLKRELSNPAVVLFGSFARGEDTEESDIDVYIETRSKKQIDLEKFKKALNREIQVFRQKSLKEIKNFHLANNIINGITLNSSIEVFP